MKAKLISLGRTSQCWVASFHIKVSRDPEGLKYVPDPEVIAAFGTHVLPCPFTVGASSETVLAEVRRLNPDADVQAL